MLRSHDCFAHAAKIQIVESGVGIGREAFPGFVAKGDAVA
jgi:hypothetical protein